ncbi:hypothetical protein YB2330_004262 [Saitoella coloradoensis]
MRLMANPYHEVDNPTGIVNIGVAENTLMHADLVERFNKCFKITGFALTYGAGFGGSPQLKEALATMYNERLHPIVPIKKEHILLMSGASAIIDALAYNTCEEGDGVLVGQPLYGGFFFDLQNRSRTKLLPVPLHGADPFGTAAVAQYEATILDARKQGIKVRVLLLCNPHNPLGQCYTREALKGYMRLCQEYDLHLVSDEIYALSVFPTKENPNPTPFTSVLSIDPNGLISPWRMHVVHGMSKDFGANGLRAGALITQHNETLLKSCTMISMFPGISSAADLLWRSVLEDKEYLNFFIEANKERLAASYEKCAEFLRQTGIPYKPSNAGHFVWVDLRRFMPNANDSLEAEQKLTDKLLKTGVYMATGESFYTEEHGWYRVTFSVDEKTMMLGLKRLAQALSDEEHGDHDESIPKGLGVQKGEASLAIKN